MNIENSLWVERYRPKKITDYVFADPQQRAQIEKWITDQDCPHILASGPAGTGKSSIFYVLINELNIDPYDVLWINASRENSIDEMRSRITSFVSSMPFGKLKIVVLDEADFLSPNAMGALRGIMEEFSTTSRFFLSCNYPNKIIPAIHSRTQQLHINKLDPTDFTVKIAEILIAENIEFDPDILDTYVKGTWPDLRKCINNCQQNSINGKLTIASSATEGSKDYKIEAIELFKKNKIREARQLICTQIRPEELEDFFRFCYDNLSLWGDTPEKQDQAILIIRKSYCQIPLCADAEILTSATLIELTQIT